MMTWAIEARVVDELLNQTVLYVQYSFNGRGFNLTTTAGSRGSARQSLLDAAAQIIIESGVDALTLEAVAAVAGVTRSGLVYHFKTRDQLLAQLVQTIAEELDARNLAKAVSRGNSPESYMRGLIDSTLDMQPEEKRLLANLLATSSRYPHLLAPAQHLFANQYGELASAGSKSATGFVLAAGLDGILLLELLDLHHFTGAQREAMRATFADLAPLLS